MHGYYQPLTMTSLMLDSALGGSPDHLLPYRRTSLILHLANTLLIAGLLYLLFGRFSVAVLVALLFGVHPLTVEPIPWVGERKTLLATFFALWSLLLYVRYAQQRGWLAYAGSMGTLVLALLAKPTVIAVPIVLLLLDYWPLKRLSWRTVIEKIPFIAVAVAFAVITVDLPGPDRFDLDQPAARPEQHPVDLGA